MLEVKNLKKYFPIKKGFVFTKVVGHVKAVDDVSFFINQGETLGLVGESGCGKTTTGRLIMRAYEPTGGEVWFKDQKLGRVNVAELDQNQLRETRMNMQMIFQDPYSSLNPRFTLLSWSVSRCWLMAWRKALSCKTGWPSCCAWSVCVLNI